MTEPGNTAFTLDARLAEDCYLLAELELSQLLLMNNALLPWFILAPRVEVVEIHQLSPHQQWILLEEINLLSHFVEQHYTTDKLNVGAIGNIVRQMHIHIIGRNSDDPWWPGVVWGAQQNERYDQRKLDDLAELLKGFLPADSRLIRPTAKP